MRDPGNEVDYAQHSHTCIFPLPTHDSIRVGSGCEDVGSKKTQDTLHDSSCVNKVTDYSFWRNS